MGSRTLLTAVETYAKIIMKAHLSTNGTIWKTMQSKILNAYFMMQLISLNNVKMKEVESLFIAFKEFQGQQQ